ncbi:MAG TPA: roadblock/LC7 domain-containing protein [Burkholderiaceae bacterium]|nr:roadblock/LC7 domain-containing protein [Burkholderiaceae bacterium]
MALDPRDSRVGMQQELAALCKKVPTAKLAAVASEDGLLTATHEQAEPNPSDRKSAMLASLIALARTAAREHGLEEARWLVLGCRLGVMVVRPFGRQRRRLLLLVVSDSEKLGPTLAAAKEFALRIDAKFGLPVGEPAQA